MTTRSDSPPRHQAAPARRARLELVALPSEVPRARHYLRGTLARWGLSQASDDIELIACELLTNAISASAALPSPGGAERPCPTDAVPPSPASTVPPPPASTVPPPPASVDLLVAVDRDRLIVTVRDTSAAEPVRPDRDDDAVAGRGLTIVDALSTAWGWAPDPPGKIVWAVLAL